MASSLHLLLFSSLFLTIYGHDTLTLPLPITKDSKTLKYITHIHLGTPSVSKKLVVDLGAPFLWTTDCESSHSFKPARCLSIQCSTANANKCGESRFSSTKTCLLSPNNTVTGMSLNGELGQDIISSIDDFLFSCAPAFLLQGLPSGAKGMLGLGQSRISLPSQLPGLERKFSLCLPSSSSSDSQGFYSSSSTLAEVSKSLMYTPLVSKPVNKDAVSTQDHSDEEYYIGVKSIRINGRKLSINEDDIRGTRLSTIVPYTTLETSIYNTFTRAFTEAAMELFNMTRVASVAPFEVCFSSNRVEVPAVPIIDLVLQSNMVKWRIHGSNSMVQVSDEAMCLGFLDGGLNARSSIVVGGYQLENNLLEFDLASSRFGFSSLLEKQIECSNLNFHGASSSSS